MSRTTPPIFPPVIYDYSTADGEDPEAVNTIRIGSPLTTNQWKRMGYAANWLLGNGGPLVWWGPLYGTLAPSSAATLVGYCWPRTNNVNRLWAFDIGWSGADSCIVTFGFASALGGALTVTLTGEVTDNNDNRRRVFLYKEAATPTTGGEQVSLTVTHHADSPATGIRVNGGTYSELPRAELPANGGVEIDSLEINQPVMSTGNDSSANALVYHMRNARAAANASRRQAIFHWNGFTAITTTSFVNLFAIDPAAQTRLLETGSNAQYVQWTVYAKVSGTTPSAEVRVTSGIYGSSTITVTSTTTIWATSKAIYAETDDLSQTANVRGGIGSRSNLTFEARRVAGTSLTIYAIAVGEEET